jgi:HK97 gp10 family phage protein
MATDIKVSVDNLDTVFAEIVDDYKKEVDSKSNKAVLKVGRETAQDLQNTSPKQTGKYAQGWKTRTENDRYGGTVSTVYQSKKPSLTHLLEFGHGGPQPAPAHEHIAPAYQKGKAKLLEAIKK